MSLTTFSMTCNASHGLESVQCDVSNIGDRDGDEVVLMYHKVSKEIASNADHPIPFKALVDFERLSIAAGDQGTLQFAVSSDTFKVVNAKGEKVLYSGEHWLIFSRGNGDDTEIRFRF